MSDEARAYYERYGWSNCAGSAWDRLSPAAQDGWRAAANERAFAESRLGRCTCDPVPMTAGGEGPSETCGLHGRTYHEWVERGDILNARIEAVKEVIAKARKTPARNDPFHVALDIADDLDRAVYLEPEPTHRDRVTGQAATAYTPPEDVECCASGRCEVCSPGYVWGRNG